jgi:hypothetical protein
MEIKEKTEKKEKIPRQAMPEQDPTKRIHNFDEVPVGYSKGVFSARNPLVWRDVP